MGENCLPHQNQNRELKKTFYNYYSENSTPLQLLSIIEQIPHIHIHSRHKPATGMVGNMNERNQKY